MNTGKFSMIATSFSKEKVNSEESSFSPTIVSKKMENCVCKNCKISKKCCNFVKTFFSLQKGGGGAHLQYA